MIRLDNIMIINENGKVSCLKEILGDMIISSLVWRGGKPTCDAMDDAGQRTFNKETLPKSAFE